MVKIYLDQAINKTGFAIFVDNKLEDYGIIKPRDIFENKIDNMFKSICEKYIDIKIEYSPNNRVLVVVEHSNTHTNMMTTQKLSELYGMLKAEFNTIFYSYEATELTKWLSDKWEGNPDYCKEKKDGTIGRVLLDKKMASTDYVNKELWGFNKLNKWEDNDIADAICLGLMDIERNNNE